MWIRLEDDFINLDHVARVRFGMGWVDGNMCSVAEVETMVSGEIRRLVRYRGKDALALRAALQHCSEPIEVDRQVSETHSNTREDRLEESRMGDTLTLASNRY